MPEQDDPLESLLLDAGEVDRARLANALKGLLGVDTKEGGVVLKPGFTALSSRQKVVAYLLGRKAAVLLGRSEDETVAPREIPKDTGMPSGTVHPKLKELRESRTVSQTDEGNYYIASHQVLKAIDELAPGKVE